MALTNSCLSISSSRSPHFLVSTPRSHACENLRFNTGKASGVFGFRLLVSEAVPVKRRACIFRAVSGDEVEESVAENIVEGEDQAANEEAQDKDAASFAKSLVLKLKEYISNNEATGIDEVIAQLEAIDKDRVYLGQQVASLSEEVSLGKDRLLRLNADFENFRKRSEREKSELASSVKGDVVELLLPMIDNFERAKTSLKTETEAEKKIENGYQSIYKQFVDAMKALGVSAVETFGKSFDPAVHDAIMREDSTEFAEGVVLEEFRKGFVIGSKLLRPAMVKVSAGPGPSGATSGDGAVDVSIEASEPGQPEQGASEAEPSIIAEEAEVSDKAS